MVVKDVDSFMTCGAVLAQMPKNEKHLPIPCNAGLSSKSHYSHFQTNYLSASDRLSMYAYINYTLLKVGYAAHFPNHFEREGRGCEPNSPGHFQL